MNQKPIRRMSNISPERLRIEKLLLETPEGSTLSAREIANATGTEAARVSQIVAGMRKDGFAANLQQQGRSGWHATSRARETANPNAAPRPIKKNFQPIMATTAALLTMIASRRKPTTEAQLRTSGLPPTHPSALNTLVRNGFLIETQITATTTPNAPKTSAYSITAKGRESIKLRQEWLERQKGYTPQTPADSEASTEFKLALPRTFYAGKGNYCDAEMRRNPYRAPTLANTTA